MASTPTKYFAEGIWKSLPLEIRQAWWQDTAHGARLPSKSFCDRLARDFKIVIKGPKRDDQPDQSDFS